MISADIISSGGFNGGSPSTLYVAQAAYASLPAGTVVGQKARATDVGPNGSEMSWNGTRWVPVNGNAVIFLSSDQKGIACTGTISTGSSGNITLGTALPRIYSEGLYLYLPTIATTPAITAGFYWIAFSSTTVGTVYASKGGAAINFTVGSAYTGVTSAVTLGGALVNGGLLGSNGALNAEFAFSQKSSANNKVALISFGGITLASLTLTTNSGQSGCIYHIRNTSASSQVSQSGLTGQIGFGSQNSSVNTAIDQNLVISGQCSNAADYIILDCFKVVLQS